MSIRRHVYILRPCRSERYILRSMYQSALSRACHALAPASCLHCTRADSHTTHIESRPSQPNLILPTQDACHAVEVHHFVCEAPCLITVLGALCPIQTLARKENEREHDPTNESHRPETQKKCHFAKQEYGAFRRVWASRSPVIFGKCLS